MLTYKLKYMTLYLDISKDFAVVVALDNEKWFQNQ